MKSKSTFRGFCEVARKISETRSTVRKTTIFAEYLQSLEQDECVELAAQFMGEGAFSSVSGKRASVGHRTVAVCASEFCDIDYELVFRACRTATGSASESIEKLMENLPAAQNRIKPEFLNLGEVYEFYTKLEQTRKRDEKNSLLQAFWEKMTPLEIKFFIRIMSQGSLRIGFEARSIVNSFAKAWNQDTEEVRYAHMITGSLGKTALLCKNNDLESARFRLFHPLSFMLASPVESRNAGDLAEYVAEEKFDGMRCQVHAEGANVKLFSRDMNDITASFPEVVTFFSSLSPKAVVLDGEICVFRDDTIQPFQELQKRMGVKKPAKKLLNQFPVVFIAYDILYIDGTPVFDETLNQRRERLQTFCEKHGIMMSRQFPLENDADVEQLFDMALAHGNEGLMLKRKDSTYEYGQRRKSWLKVKKPGGSVDTVIMYAHAGSGKRGGLYSDFTLGISVADDERYEEMFIPIGKAYGGYTDDELKKLNKAIKSLVAERFGSTLSLKPGIVVEIEFDDIQINKRTKAGITLRLPRFRAIRWDLSPSDADTLKDVEKLLEEKMNQKREKITENPAVIRY